MSEFREAVIDLGAIQANVAHLRRLIRTRHTMAVVKANGYGHGAVQVARAALAGGADWLGVADIDEGLALRAAGIDAPLLAWLHSPEPDFAAAIVADIDLGLSSALQVRQAADAASRLGRTANVQIKLETGLNRNGVDEADWAEVLTLAAAFERVDRLRVRGLFSHLANTSAADDEAAIASFDRGLAAALAAGLTIDLAHLASTAAALRLPAARYSMVRLGIGIYGQSPFADADSAALGFTAAMTLRARVAAVRRVADGAGVSYDYLWRAAGDTTLALVPLGYADGVPRQAMNAASVAINGVQYPVVGRVAMDQFLVDVGSAPVAVGDNVVLFGDAATGAPTAAEWGAAAGTINYDIVTRVGARVPRRYLPAAVTGTDASADASDADASASASASADDTDATAAERAES
ncbi:alanine racemase [Cryobacterium sp. 1639]|uniref:alanine racemase n=1 Tax=Cryobacterium inferilacus TaxID=2866629 RepID=UPI001C73521B|nr:alanine racemase [Cryobacterium sp. 1639]MBX0301032.1 alanine racemase [Cryobacterium sp. 1639]